MGSNVSPNSLVLPERLKSLPVLVLGLLKCAALRGTGRDVNTDERTAVGHQMVAAPVEDVLRLTYPACYPVYELGGAMRVAGAGEEGWGRRRRRGLVCRPRV